MAKYRVFLVEKGWMERTSVYEVEANSAEEAEEHYSSGICMDSYEDSSYEEFGIDPDLTEEI